MATPHGIGSFLKLKRRHAVPGSYAGATLPQTACREASASADAAVRFQQTPGDAHHKKVTNRRGKCSATVHLVKGATARGQFVPGAAIEPNCPLARPGVESCKRLNRKSFAHSDQMVREVHLEERWLLPDKSRCPK